MSAKYNVGMDTATGVAQAQPLPIFLSEMERINTSLTQLRKTIIALEERLGPISQPAMPESASGMGNSNQTPPRPVSPLTSQLQSQRTDIESLTERVGRMLTYLDL